MKQIKLLVMTAILLSVLTGKGAYADHYYGRYDDRSHRQYRPYYNRHNGNEAYTQSRSYGYNAPGNRSEYHISASEGYYSCPRGDYISDRPGRCPLDGSVLIPRGSSYNSKKIYSESYDRYY